MPNEPVSWIRFGTFFYVSRVTPDKPAANTVDNPVDDEETRPLEVPGDSAPVFVDSSGRRGRRIRFAFYGIGGLSLTYAGMVAMSLAGGPLNPETLLPFPDLLINRPAAVDSTPEPAQPARAGTTRPGDPRRTTQNGEAAPAPRQSARPGVPAGPPGPPPVIEATPAPSTTRSQAPASQPPSTAPSGNPAPSTTQTNPAPGSGGGSQAPAGPGPESNGGTGTNTPTGTNTGGSGTGTGGSGTGTQTGGSASGSGSGSTTGGSGGTTGGTTTGSGPGTTEPAPTPAEPQAAPPAQQAAAPAHRRAETAPRHRWHSGRAR